MTNALFLSSRWLDAASVTASSVQGSLAANNVKTFRPDQVWRATGCAAEWLAWDFGSATEVEASVLLAHNLSAEATIRLRLAATASDVTAAPVIDTGFVSAWPTSGKPDDPDWPSWFSLLLFEQVTIDAGGFLLSENGDILLTEGGDPIISEAGAGGFGFILEETGDVLLTESGDLLTTEDEGSFPAYRYGRIDIVDPSNPDGYVQVGRLYAGPAFVPADNIDINWSLSLVSPGEVTRSPFGRTFTDDRGPPSRVMTIPFSALDETELTDELYELERYCGVARDFAFCVDPAATTKFHKWAMQARFDAPQPAQAQPYFNSDGQKVWQSTLILAEVL